HPTFKYFGYWGSGEAVDRRSGRAGREEPSSGGGKRLRSARSSNGCGFHGWRRLAVRDDVGRGADAALASLGSCTGDRAGDTGGGPGTLPRNRGALLASGSGEAMYAGGDQRSAGISESGIGAARAAASSDVSDRRSAERICEMALLAGVGGGGCGCVLLDCKTQTVGPADGSAIGASAAGCGGRKRTARHGDGEPWQPERGGAARDATGFAERAPHHPRQDQGSRESRSGCRGQRGRSDAGISRAEQVFFAPRIGSCSGLEIFSGTSRCTERCQGMETAVHF